MVTISNKILGKTLYIKSRFEEVEIVDKEIDDWLTQIGIDSDLAYHIGLAVHEAVVNAVKHGNNLQGLKRVVVKFGIVDGEMVFEVKDEGSGFNVNKLPDPLAPENIWKESGRGIYLMKKFMDRIDFKRDKDGFQVILCRKLPTSP